MEPERPIEKVLRASASKRREEAGAPFELHPATRRLLQGEVARRFGQASRPPRSFPEFLAGLWPKAVWGFAVLGMVGIMAAILVPALNKPSKTNTLARNDGRKLGLTDELNRPAPVAVPEAA